ncbi:hypothetical protein G9A89_005148 [Geosiphon pyriformis]|nr:hypothetical protein G9A89_005148 [Geosiphon pyriformis]
MEITDNIHSLAQQLFQLIQHQEMEITINQQTIRYQDTRKTFQLRTWKKTENTVDKIMAKVKLAIRESTKECVVVCFDSAESLNATMGTTPMLRSANLHWSSLVSARCTKYKKLGHMSLSCAESGKVSFGSSLCRVLSDADKNRLAAIYAKCSILVVCPVFFGGLFWAKVANGLSFPLFLAELFYLTNLAEHVDMLAKKLETSEPIVSQLSPGCQLLITPSLQN